MNSTRQYRRADLKQDLPALFSSSRLLQCYGPLIYLGMRLRGGEQPTELPALFHQRTLKRLEDARERAGTLGCPRERIDGAERAVIALLDTAVFELMGPYRDFWAQGSLEMDRYGSQVAGHRFFSLLKALRQERSPEAKELLEIVYLCLLAGFEGEYRGRRSALEQLVEELRQELASRGGPKPLSPQLTIELPEAPASAEGPPARLLLAAACGFVIVLGLMIAAFVHLQASETADTLGQLTERYAELRPDAQSPSPPPVAPTPPEGEEPAPPEDPPSTSPVDPPPAAPAGYPLSIDSTPPGATVFINGENVGLTPLVDHRLPQSWYKVELVLGDSYFTRQIPVSDANNHYTWNSESGDWGPAQ